MKTKILIIGSKGMAGHVIYYYLKETGNYDVVDISRSNEHFISDYNTDVTEIDDLEKVIKLVKPHFIINCVGLLNREAENNPDRAIFINSYIPHFLARLATLNNCRLIHISTDCVFSGKKGDYTSNDPKDGIGFYATSKALGEVTYGNHITLRTSIVGPELKQNGIGLFDWFMKQDGVVKGYTKAIWTGITTVELAGIIDQIISGKISLEGGLFHLVNGQKISKYELLNLFKNVFEKNNITIELDDKYVVDKSLLPGPYKFGLKAYIDMISGMKDWIYQHPHLYSAYTISL